MLYFISKNYVTNERANENAFQRVRFVFLKKRTNQAFGSCDSSWGAKSLTPDGPTPQISVAYSVMVRSLENLPEAAILRRHIRAHSMGFWYSSLTRR